MESAQGFYQTYIFPNLLWIIAALLLLAMVSLILVIVSYCRKKEKEKIPSFIFSTLFSVLTLFFGLATVIPSDSPVRPPPDLRITDNITSPGTGSLPYNVGILVHNYGGSSASNSIATAVFGGISYNPVVKPEINPEDSAYIYIIRVEQRNNKWYSWSYTESMKEALAKGNPPIIARAIPPDVYDLELSISCRETGVSAERKTYRLTISDTSPPEIILVQ